MNHGKALDAGAFMDRLLRVICRTKKNVDFAAAVLERVALKRVVHLDVHFRSDLILRWTADELVENENPWRNFQTWFHGREDSETYCIQHSKGSSGLMRRDIKRYETRRDLVKA